MKILVTTNQCVRTLDVGAVPVVFNYDVPMGANQLPDYATYKYEYVWGFFFFFLSSFFFFFFFFPSCLAIMILILYKKNGS